MTLEIFNTVNANPEATVEEKIYALEKLKHSLSSDLAEAEGIR